MFVERRIAHLHFARPEPGLPRLAGIGADPAAVAGDRSRAMLRQDAQLVTTGEQRVGCDQLTTVKDPHLAALTLHCDGLTDQLEGHRVAVGLDADQVVLGDDPGQAGLVTETAVAGDGL